MTRKTSSTPKMTRGQRVIAFIEQYCRAPDGALVGQPMVLDEFQKRFILEVYDNPHVTFRAILSMARKNGKTALIASILLAHIVGPEARVNSEIVSGAMSRDQAAIIFDLACKIIALSPPLRDLTRIIPSSKVIHGLARNVTFRSLSAEGKTSHGKSPALAILDEMGQVRGPSSEFVDAIITAQGAHEDRLLIVISTQAPNDADMLSIWIDDALTKADPHTVCHLHTSPLEAELDDEAALRLANPALDHFRSRSELEEAAKRAKRMPSFEPAFRNLYMNQRVEATAPFITRSVWTLNSGEPDPAAFYEAEVYAGLDLSAKCDLTAMVMVARHAGKFHVKALFWTPEKGLRDRAKRDRAPYDIWVDQGFIRALPGASIDYEQVARDILDATDGCALQALTFDRWRIDILKREFARLGAPDLPWVPFGQGFKDMAPALDATETLLLNDEMLHGGNPVLTMCMSNSRVERDAAGNRKLNKAKATGRIDGAVALVMAAGAAAGGMATEEKSFWEVASERA